MRLEELRGSGAMIVLERCDAGDEKQVQKMLERVRKKHGPICGVVHAAGVLSDAMILNQNDKSMRHVFVPKAGGAWYLHRHTLIDPLDVFMVFSSIASVFGNPGQGNYAAANAAMDELVRWRVAQGLCGTSAQWPAVAGVGMAAAMDSRVQIDDTLRIRDVSVKQAVVQLLRCGAALANPVQSVLPPGMLEAGVLPASMATFISSVKRPSSTNHGRAHGDTGVGLLARRPRMSKRMTSIEGIPRRRRWSSW